jgi:aminopeptidase YwaD
MCSPLRTLLAVWFHSFMRRALLSFLLFLFTIPCSAKSPLDESILKPFSQEISGELAKKNLEFLSRQHRMRGSRGFERAAEFIVDQLRKYGIQDARVQQFPADGKIFYGTQRSRKPWDADFAELWEMKDGKPQTRIASWDSMPLSLAQDSESADVTAFLVDAGAGTSEADYVNKDVSGRLVLVSEQPESVIPFAIDRFHAAGIISYAQNQKTAWWGEDENLVRWGHVGSFNKNPSFAFMISLKKAREFKKRMEAGEQISLHARVVAGQHDGSYQIVTATIPGADPILKNEEIVFSCHLDHPRPGANDNASGCAAILEVARSVAKLIEERKVERPARTLRFVWPPEVEGTMTFLAAQPEVRARIKYAIHMDMVGGGPVTKSVFHITRGPASRPSFIYDLADYVGEFVNDQTSKFADTGVSDYPLISQEGGKEALNAVFAPFSMGSDHEINDESTFGIPSIYFNDWPDRYIHTNFDVPANIDPTKLKRAAFMGAVVANFLSNYGKEDEAFVTTIVKVASLKRRAESIKRTMNLSAEDANCVERFIAWYEKMVSESIYNGPEPPQIRADHGKNIFVRNTNLLGPMGTFGYNYLDDHYGATKAKALKIRNLENGEIYEYEVLNFVDGHRSTREIRDFLTGAYGSVPLNAVEEYLAALESIGVVRTGNTRASGQ